MVDKSNWRADKEVKTERAGTKRLDIKGDIHKSVSWVKVFVDKTKQAEVEEFTLSLIARMEAENQLE